MNLSPLNVPQLLHQAGLRPDKRLGQNFLLDDAALYQVVESAQIDPQDIVLEIGPGLGSLTRLLALAASRVIAVELDGRLIPLLHQIVAPFPNVQILQGDILALNLAQLLPDPGYLVVANIPYYITSSVIRHLLETASPPRRFVLTVQSEVAGRICASPGDMSLLALSVQVYGLPQVTARIPAESFYPAPNVDSSVVRVDLYANPRIPALMLDSFFCLIKAGFSQKRKTLRNALAGGLGWTPSRAAQLLENAGIDPMRRAETLSIPEWEQLVLAYTP
ncbi:MAG: ribosomal RNA small subunit methyltransferase A [Chloroflexi bacterium RBG_19FT_COMBO_50_10]|nr:MAG: ribosomal RNA small subunit methyltransferase A [Chloroflexi bacterium RBG_19FT_COMBO_50_10]